MKIITFIFIIAVFSINSFASRPLIDFYFEHITIADGLSQNYITCIQEDAEGFIWIGTKNGLNKYDGYKITEYNHMPDAPYSITDSYISIIYKDSQNNLWIGTNNGLCRYRREYDDFEAIDFTAVNNNAADRVVISLFEDIDHVLWIGTSGGMLYSLNPDKKTLTPYPPSFEKTAIKEIIRYRDSLIIGCSNNGLLYLDTDNKKFHKIATETSLERSVITSFSTDKDDNLWIGTRYQGLFKYGHPHNIFSDQTILDICNQDSFILIGTEENGLICFNHYTEEYQSIKTGQKGNNLNSDAITCLYLDSTGILWVGTTNGGVNKYDIHKNIFKHLSLSSENQYQLSMHSVYAMESNDEKTLLIGLDTKGLLSLNNETGEIDKKQIGKYSELNGSSINTILKDSRDIIWVGLYKKGVTTIGPTETVSQINKLLSLHLSESTSVKYIIEDSKQRIWIGTSDKGVLCYNPLSNSIKAYDTTFNIYLSSNIITSILEDDEQRIWVGTINGLFQYMEHSDRFQLILLPDNNSVLSTRNTIIPICQVADNLWLGTRQGLIKYNFKKNQSHILNQSDGLPSESIKGLLYDNNGNGLWISTDKGLSRLDLSTDKFTNFGLKDGIISTEFNDMSVLKARNGMFYFGGVDGIYYFHPDHIKTNPNPPKVVITHYRLYDNKSDASIITPTPQIPVTQGQEIKIPYNEGIFSIDFVALNYTNSNKNQYAYKLDGHDNNWKFVGDQRMATYTNLSPGSYVFNVIASNNDGIWNEKGSSLRIVILPPWWRTPWAYLLYFILAGITIAISIRIYTTRLKMKNQLINEQFERAQLEKLDQLKSQFFSNITHEFRTPLTLIISPLEILMKNKSNQSNKNEYLEIIKRNTNKLLALVNQFLDFSKADSNQFLFTPSVTDITLFIKNEIESFIPLAKEKQQHLHIICNPDNFICIADSNIIEKIVYNLLSNAIKYTPKNGEIIVNAKIENQDNNDLLILTVKDTGKGIPQDKQKLIFERFYQLDEKTSAGTGIGLSLAKSLTELHHGSIEVESEPDHGSLFTVKIPLERTYDNSFKPYSYPTSDMEAKEDKEEHYSYNKLLEDKDKKNQLRQTILIAEDNNDLRIFISSILSDKYTILEAENGVIALELAKKENPDIILSDILMPEMDGKQLCQQIKQDMQTCHIPFIMITALTSEINQMEGLAVGSDDYIVKPFSPEILKIKIKNALKSRSLISRHQTTLSAMKPEEVTVEDKDTAFLLDVIEYIKANVSEPDLKVDDLSQNSGMSRTPFFKKIKSLTGMTPNDFIRNIRLNQAAKLLSDSDLGIAEIAYNIGFTSPKYFRECFKKQFGITPSEYMEQNRHI